LSGLSASAIPVVFGGRKLYAQTIGVDINLACLVRRRFQFLLLQGIHHFVRIKVLDADAKVIDTGGLPLVRLGYTQKALARPKF
jgi:hypothetical protein